MEILSANGRSAHPKHKAGLISSIFFWWTFSVIKKGNKKPYEVEDLPDPLPGTYSQELGDKLEKAWLEEMKNSATRKKEPSLLKTLFRLFGGQFFVVGLLHSFNEFFISILRQILLGYFLKALKESKENLASQDQVVMFGVILVSTYALNNLLGNHFLAKGYHLGCQMKIALSSVMYRKCFRLGNNLQEHAFAGRILNLMSNDLARFDDIIMYLNYSYSGLISTLIIGTIISYEINVYVASICLVSVFITAPIQLFISKQMASFRSRIANASDKRIRLMDEIINGIQIIKMYAWERPYERLLMHKRRAEIQLIKRGIYLRAMRLAMNVTVSKFSLYSIIVVYVMSGGKVVPEMVFVLLGYCSIMAKVTSGMFFRSFGECSECRVSIKRIQNFLKLKEFTKPIIHAKDENTDVVLEFKRVIARWSLDENKAALNDINLSIREKKLTTILGEVGSGKSSFLNCILGELPANNGEVILRGTVSYYSQVPWLFAGTIKTNILFSEKYNPERYSAVIKACALEHDFQFLPNGDSTIIGERGITLSGGQKARIALARAVYKKADIYLLDDPLSAVDAKVNKHIFQECIMNFLNKKTRILVTHQLQFLMNSDHIVLFKEGRIEKQGNFQTLVNSDLDLMNIFKRTKSENEGVVVFDQIVGSTASAFCSKLILNKAENQEESEEDIYAKQFTNAEMEKEDNELTDPFALVRFLNRGAGLFGIAIVIVLFILTQIAVSGCDVWLAYWTSAEHAVAKHETDVKEVWYFFSFEFSRTDYFVIGYTTVLIFVIITVTLRNLICGYYGQRCSMKIHRDAFNSLMRTNSSFFHNNPSGRILNRFSKDMGAVDEILTSLILEATSIFVYVLAAFVISSSISALYIFPAILIVMLLFVVRHFYVKTSVNLKRLESITKSPIFVHVHSTLQGLSVIRSCSVTNELIREFDIQQDVYSSAWYLYNLTGFGYAYCLEVICLIYLAIIVTGAFFLDLTGSQVGLALAQLTILLNFVQWAMKLSADVTNQVTSVDRLMRYSQLKPEKQPEGDSVFEDWPSKGRIAFKNVDFKYDLTSSPSIKNVSFVIEPEEKIGIVGRTGAGKTTLLAAMFRLGYVEGSVKIDDVDTSIVRLEKLRSKISVIPQDPVLFSGTLRSNIDPFGEFDDFTLWKALEQAQLKKIISENNNNGLDTMITEGGKNFSVGQRQLICLARAIIRRNKILILDEATANIDQRTDSIIQNTIREKLKFCTVLTIAHRLNTVIDSDKILLMDNGTAIEYGHPYELLSNRGSHFYKLVSETGDFVAANLAEIAKENYEFEDRKIDLKLKISE